MTPGGSSAGNWRWTKTQVGRAAPAVVGFGLLELAHTSLAHLAAPYDYFRPLVLFAWGSFHVQLAGVRNPGEAFGALQENGVARIVVLATGMALFAAFADLLRRLIPDTYRWQRRALLMGASGGLGNAMERLLTGAVRDYFLIARGDFAWPAVNLFSLALYGSVLPFLLLLAARLFGRHRVPPHAPEGRLYDPLYERRRSIRALLSLLGAMFLLVAATSVVSAASALRILVCSASIYRDQNGDLGGPPSNFPSWMVDGTGWHELGRRERIGEVVVRVLLLCWRFVPPALIAWLIFRWVPSRRMEVIFLRAFSRDRESHRLLRRLRGGLGRDARITGVTRPGERYRWRDLLLLWVFPFAVVGDLGQVMAGGHTIFLDKDWTGGVKLALGGARAAVFDARTITEALAWEIGQSIGLLGAQRTFFVVGTEGPAAELRAAVKQASGSAADLDLARCYREGELGSLVAALRDAVAQVPSALSPSAAPAPF